MFEWIEAFVAIGKHGTSYAVTRNEGMERARLGRYGSSF
jgi:hypothetical protein